MTYVKNRYGRIVEVTEEQAKSMVKHQEGEKVTKQEAEKEMKKK